MLLEMKLEMNLAFKVEKLPEIEGWPVSRLPFHQEGDVGLQIYYKKLAFFYVYCCAVLAITNRCIANTTIERTSLV